MSVATAAMAVMLCFGDPEPAPGSWLPSPLASEAALAAPAAPDTLTAGEGPAPVDPNPPHEAEIVVSTRRPPASDPLEAVNVKSFEATAAVDRGVFEPLAKSYARIAPKPMRLGLRHALANLHEPIVALNFMLQLKPGKALGSVARFLVNSTLGLAGLVDVARRKPFCLARRPNGFANTLGFYGIGAGPFFYVPLVGPTTLRDLFGGGVDRLLLPMAVGKPFGTPAYVATTGTLNTLDRRIRNDDRIAAVRAAADPYATSRAAYLDRRFAEIETLRGRGDPMAGASLSNACLARAALLKARRAARLAERAAVPAL